MRHRLFVCATLSLGLTFTAVAAEAVKAPALRSAPVQVIRGDTQGISLDAVVEAGRQTVIAAQVSGAIVALPVKAGDRVKGGQVLLRLDARAAQSGVAASHAQLESARAQASLAEKELKRQQALFEKQYISQAAVERSRVALVRLPSNFGVHSSARRMPGKERRDERWSDEQSQVHLGVQARSRQTGQGRTACRSGGQDLGDAQC